MASITPNTRKALTKALTKSTSEKLKKEIEQICNRYQTGCVESDEIDLRTMEIVVDNGHLSNKAVEEGGHWGVVGESNEFVNNSDVSDDGLNDFINEEEEDRSTSRETPDSYGASFTEITTGTESSYNDALHGLRQGIYLLIGGFAYRNSQVNDSAALDNLVQRISQQCEEFVNDQRQAERNRETVKTAPTAFRRCSNTAQTTNINEDKNKQASFQTHSGKHANKPKLKVSRHEKSKAKLSGKPRGFCQKPSRSNGQSKVWLGKRGRPPQFPFTQEESELLNKMIRSRYSWKIIGNAFPTKTLPVLKNHWQRVLKD